MTERFGFPFKGNHLSIEGVRIHYVDEGSGPPVLMVHGNLEWSYTYRKMIPRLAAAGYRCVAPDLMGHGLSGKPSNESAYNLQKHVRIVTELVVRLGLRGITTVGGVWGGPISLRYAIEHQENVRALVILGTLVRPMKLPALFRVMFRSGGLSSFLVRRLDLFRRMMYSRIGFRRPLDPRALAQYKLPNSTAATRASLAAFPKMIPTDLRHPNGQYIADIETALGKWDVPVLVMFADKDMAFDVNEGQRIAHMVPNGRFFLVRNAGHFLAEDAGEEMADRIVSFLRDEASGSGSGEVLQAARP
ncbi:MAG: alpha/beta fold hydrolase [Chloroflexi bacterium]|nr:alpha/beta fold hydrolase [Chloroflexota bacterium]